MVYETLLRWHIFAIAFWLGVVGVEFILEQSRAKSREQGFAVALYHYKVDLFLEFPAFTLALVTGLLLIDATRMDGLYLLKVVLGLVAVTGNLICLLPIIKRKQAAEVGDLQKVILYSRHVDLISLIAMPAGILALIIGPLL